jgi:CzcA family heavy metal efflux pump
MLNRIIDKSLHNRAIVIALSALLLIFGTYSTSNMEVDVFPDLTAPTVTVITEAHGLAPEEVERRITMRIESAVNGTTQVRRVRSSTAAGISIVWVEFEWGTDIYRARQMVTEKLSTISGSLPLGVSEPVLAPNSSIMGEIMLISITADSTSLMDVRTIADWDVRNRLLGLTGVSQVVVIGGEHKEYQVLVSPSKMMHYGVTLEEVLKAAEESGANVSGGFMNEHGNEYVVRGLARTDDTTQIGGTFVKMVNGQPVCLRDVARVTYGASQKIGDGSRNGSPAVILTVMKQPSTNTLDLTERIDSAMADLNRNIASDIKINTHIFRQADFINASVNNIQKTLIEGSIFVIVILMMFLMNWRATVISLLAIPVSLLVAFLALKWLGFTINTMSLGGMAIAIGDLVDDAIIDVENVLKRLKENALKPIEERVNKLKVIYDASVEIRSSVINATFIIIAAFVPLFFLSGMEGRLLAPLGIAFIVALFASLIVAITLTPVLCSMLLANDKRLQKDHKETWLVRKLNNAYSKFLNKALGKPVLVIGTAVGLFVVAIVLMFGLGRSFLPEFNEGSLTVSVVTMPGASLAESNKIGNQVEQLLLTIPEIQQTTRRTGRAELDEHAQGVNASEIDAPFILEERSREEFLAEVREKLGSVSSANITLGQPIGHRIDHMLSGTRANIAVKIFGSDLNTLNILSKQVKTAIDSIDGLVDVVTEQQIQIPQLQIKPKSMMLPHYGITPGQFCEYIDVAFAGERANDIYVGDKTFDLIVRYDAMNRGSIDNIRNTIVDAHDSAKVPFSEIAEITSTTGPNTINRENVQRKTVVSVNVTGRDQKGAVDEIRDSVLSQVDLPEGYRIEYGGQFEAEAEASKTLLVTSLLSLLVIFFLLYMEFKEVKTAGIILVNLPLALIGGVLSLSCTSGILSIPAIIGFITLFGIATRNGILLVSHYKTLQAQGGNLRDIVLQGSKDRLSPILMTALTAGLALIPLAIAGDLPGNEIQSPMAKVILGGLLSSTLLNLFVVPIIYYLTNPKN